MADGSDVDTVISSDEKRALFDALEKARGRMATAVEAMGKATRNIADKCGTGPFIWQGSEITLAKRGDGFVVRTKSKRAEEIV